MILATVGTQLPFDRLTAELAKLVSSLEEEIVAQIGPDGAAAAGLDCRATLTPQEFETLFTNARVVVAHAGIGTILAAKRWRKPLVILPRRHALGEHRNDHQMATARQVADLPGLHVAWEASDLEPLLRQPDLAPATGEKSASHAALIARLHSFVGP